MCSKTHAASAEQPRLGEEDVEEVFWSLAKLPLFPGNTLVCWTVGLHACVLAEVVAVRTGSYETFRLALRYADSRLSCEESARRSPDLLLLQEFDLRLRETERRWLYPNKAHEEGAATPLGPQVEAVLKRHSAIAEPTRGVFDYGYVYEMLLAYHNATEDTFTRALTVWRAQAACANP